MITNYQQMEYQALIDLLAEETQRCTRALTKGDRKDIDRHGVTMAALIAEIKARKREGSLPTTINAIPPNDFFEAAT